jgi:hypothetical protein
MKTLFFMRNASGYFRLFAPLFDELLARGHQVHVAVDSPDRLGGDEWLEKLRRAQPGFSYSVNRALRESRWYELARTLRLSRDYVEALRPAFSSAPELVTRAESRAPRHVRRAFRRRRLRAPRVVAAVARALDDAVPVFRSVRELVASHEPDVVLVAPHLMPGSLHTMYVRAAQSLGVRTGICVASWDNLSSKQLLRVGPDAVFVWNETQRDEAVRLHGIAPERVVVTGAQCYDPWFSWRPRPREEFCTRVGLDPALPYALFVGGSLFPAETTEAEFAARWIEELRSSGDPDLRRLGVLLRPHPKRGAEWGAVDFERFGGVRVWPTGSRMPVSTADRADFFDSVYHSAAVFGINTSAMIEAGIVGRPVLTLLLPEFAGSQEGVFHFRYLTDVGGGLLVVARSLDEHLAQLAETVRSPDGARARAEAFLEAFVRPHGLDRAASPILADEIERLAALGPAPAPRRPAHRRVVAAALAPAAVLAERDARRRKRRKRDAVARG